MPSTVKYHLKTKNILFQIDDFAEALGTISNIFNASFDQSFFFLNESIKKN
jgi:hypothetical protein